jgi:hypothetical protein
MFISFLEEIKPLKAAYLPKKALGLLEQFPEAHLLLYLKDLILDYYLKFPYL